MDHEVVVRQQMTERYLLDELDPHERAEFEEHFFECRACALDVQAGALFVSQSKVALAEEPISGGLPVPTSVPVTSGSFAWLRPTVAVPAMALLLTVIGYQNLVMYPQLGHALNRPQVLPFASMNVGTRGSSGHAITTGSGEAFLLFVRIPPDGSYANYTANLYNPAGKLEWSLTIPAVASQDQWPVEVPGGNREPGTYKLVVRGVTATGESKEIGGASFELQIQK
jgi:hypothetical protein